MDVPFDSTRLVSIHRAIAESAMRWAVVVGMALMLTGCGGSSKGNSRPSPGLGFQARVNRVCGAKYGSAHTPTFEGRPTPSLTEIATARARTARELSALQPPGALMNGYHRLVSLISREAALYRRMAGYLHDRNDAAAIATDRELRSNPVPKQARLVGLANCA